MLIYVFISLGALAALVTAYLLFAGRLRAAIASILQLSQADFQRLKKEDSLNTDALCARLCEHQPVSESISRWQTARRAIFPETKATEGWNWMLAELKDSCALGANARIDAARDNALKKMGLFTISTLLTAALAAGGVYWRTAALQTVLETLPQATAQAKPSAASQPRNGWLDRALDYVRGLGASTEPTPTGPTTR